MFAHVSESGNRMHQHIPFPLSILGPKYEYMIMKLLGIMSDTNWLYRFRITRWIVDKLANQVVIPIIHGEVVTPDEIDSLVHQLEKEGHPIYVGICECRHGENRIDPEMVEGHDPNYTCVMIGDWGRGPHLQLPQILQAHQCRRADGADPFLARARTGCSTPGASAPATVSSSPTATASPSTVSRCATSSSEAIRCSGPDTTTPWSTRRSARALMIASGTAASDCWFNAISVEGGKPVVDTERCHGCGQCFEYCPTGAAAAVRKEDFELYYLLRRPPSPRSPHLIRIRPSEANSGEGRGY